jgi:hypothetical protein
MCAAFNCKISCWGGSLCTELPTKKRKLLCQGKYGMHHTGSVAARATTCIHKHRQRSVQIIANYKQHVKHHAAVAIAGAAACA